MGYRAAAESANFQAAFQAPTTDRQAFLRRVYGMLTVTIIGSGALATTIVTSEPLLAMAAKLYIPAFIAWIILGFFEGAIARMGNAGGLIVLALNALLVGVILGPVLGGAMAIGGVDLVVQAFGLTTCVFGGLTAYVLYYKADYSWMGGLLFMACFALLGFGLIQMFFPFEGAYSLFCFLGVALMCGFILYETSVILHRFRTDQAPLAAAMLFSSFALLFLYIIRLLAGSRN